MSKLDFIKTRNQILRRGGDDEPEVEEITTVCKIIRACESSGLSLEEIVLLLEGNVRERIKLWFSEYSGREMFIGPGYYCTEEIEKIINDLTPQGGKEAKHDAKT